MQFDTILTLPKLKKKLLNLFIAGMGLQWNNLFEINSPNDKVSAGDLLVLLLLDAFIYFCITIYIETAFPGHYGIAKPWYFPLQVFTQRPST